MLFECLAKCMLDHLAKCFLKFGESLSHVFHGLIGGWWLVVGGWWLVARGSWLVVGGWWLVAGDGRCWWWW